MSQVSLRTVTPRESRRASIGVAATLAALAVGLTPTHAVAAGKSETTIGNFPWQGAMDAARQCMPPGVAPANTCGPNGQPSACAPGQGRIVYVGATNAAVGAGLSVDLTITLRAPFKGLKVVIPAAQAANFLVNSVKVGAREQLIGSGSIPGEAFSSTQETTGYLDLEWAPVSQVIVVNVTNITGGAARIDLSIMGITP